MNRTLRFGLAYFLGFVTLLVLVPRWFPVHSEGMAAAAADGYHSGAAYWTALLWTLCGILFFRWLHRRDRAPDGPQSIPTDPRGKGNW